jgi:hypothetical protein
MMRLDVFQHNPQSIYCVYKFTNFLKEDYLDLLTRKTAELTQSDSMSRQTNVYANMTKYSELLKHPEYKDFLELCAQQLLMIFSLKTPHSIDKVEVAFRDVWGMTHVRGDFTKAHWHMSPNISWSGAFCLKSPSEKEPQDAIAFYDFNVKDIMTSNTLYLFHSLVKHEVSEHLSKEPRISLGFNLDLNVIKEPSE